VPCRSLNASRCTSRVVWPGGAVSNATDTWSESERAPAIVIDAAARCAVASGAASTTATASPANETGGAHLLSAVRLKMFRIFVAPPLGSKRYESGHLGTTGRCGQPVSP